MPAGSGAGRATPPTACYCCCCAVQKPTPLRARHPLARARPVRWSPRRHTPREPITGPRFPLKSHHPLLPLAPSPTTSTTSPPPLLSSTSYSIGRPRRFVNFHAEISTHTTRRLPTCACASCRSIDERPRLGRGGWS